MSIFKAMLENTTIQFQRKIEKACAPLVEYFGLRHFWYHKVTNSGYLSAMSNLPAWAEYFFSEMNPLIYPYFRHPRNFCDKIILSKINDVEDPELNELHCIAKEKYNVHHSFMTIQKTTDGVEFFAFALNYSNERQHALLISELSLILLFIKSFRKENQSIFDSLEDNQVNVSNQLGENFLTTHISGISDISSRNVFLKKIGLEIPKALSAREIEVMKLLLNGFFSANEIAEKMNLSKRTIEAYIENIKNKLDCFSKPELIRKAIDLESIGYF